MSAKPKRKKPKNSSARLFVGLGNPGAEYCETRHNVGFRVIDRLAEEWGLSLKKPLFRKYEIACYEGGADRRILLKPLTYMNLSGKVLPTVMRRWGVVPEEVFILCDNMDLPPGEIRIRKKGSSCGHNGLASVIAALGTQNFNRIYLGIGRPADSAQTVSHVLGLSGHDETRRMTAGQERAKDALISLEDQPLDRVINEYNRRNPG